MHESEKIEEAKYHLLRMKEFLNDDNIFRYELNAFLASARSIFQYALEEIKSPITISRTWYDSAVKQSVYVKFFKDKRDTVIHHKPIDTDKIIIIKAKISIFFFMAFLNKMLVNSNIMLGIYNKTSKLYILAYEKIVYRVYKPIQILL